MTVIPTYAGEPVSIRGHRYRADCAGLCCADVRAARGWLPLETELSRMAHACICTTTLRRYRTMAEVTVTCSCGADMVERLNPYNRSTFMGCSRFPECRETCSVPAWLEMRRAGAIELPGLDD